MLDSERKRGLRALKSTPWIAEAGIDTDDTPWVIDAMFGQFPDLESKHYVSGRASPFIFKGPAVKVFRNGDGTIASAQATWAVYAGEFSGNASRVMQGGAIASIFDLTMACFGSLVSEPGRYGLTKSLYVRYRRGAKPFRASTR